MIKQLDHFEGGYCSCKGLNSAEPGTEPGWNVKDTHSGCPTRSIKRHDSTLQG